jgi:hypothetical protein
VEGDGPRCGVWLLDMVFRHRWDRVMRLTGCRSWPRGGPLPDEVRYVVLSRLGRRVAEVCIRFIDEGCPRRVRTKS